MNTKRLVGLVLSWFCATSALGQVSPLELQRACEKHLKFCSLYDEPRLKLATACECYTNAIMDNYKSLKHLKGLARRFHVNPGLLTRENGLGLSRSDIRSCENMVPVQPGCFSPDKRHTRLEATLTKRTDHPHPHAPTATVLECEYAIAGKPPLRMFYWLDKKNGKTYHPRGYNRLDNPLKPLPDCPKHPDWIKCNKYGCWSTSK